MYFTSENKYYIDYFVSTDHTRILKKIGIILTVAEEF